jgi:AraC-like DNA-binding protein
MELSRVLEALGHNPQQIISAVDVDPQLFREPDARLPIVTGAELLRHCVEVTGCEHLGLLLGKRIDPSHLGMVGFLAKYSATVEQALRLLVANVDMQDDGSSLLLETEEGYTSLVYAMQAPGLAGVATVYDFCITACYQVFRAMCGNGWRAAAVFLERRQPEHRQAYDQYFNCPVYFNSPDCRITFSSSCLSQQPASADWLLLRHLEREAAEWRRTRHENLVDAIPRALRRGLLLNRFSAADIAMGFAVHERTLHRKLRAAGTSFRSELDQARYAVGEQMLLATDLPVSEVAASLGYANSSGFIRAFQRWTGASPSLWRRDQGPAD